MTRSLLVAFLVALAFIGIADSWYLAESATKNASLFCDIGAGLDGCNIVAQSPYSKFFGVPLAYYGVAFYAVLFVLAAFLTMFPFRSYFKALVVLTGLGTIASAVFVFIQLALIQAICIYCILSALIALLSFGVSYLLFVRFAPRLPVVVP